MNQSKISLTDKLRQLGVWEDASWWKDQRKRQLVDEGMTRREARERAWDEMEEQFSGINLDRYFALQKAFMADYPPLLDSSIADAEDEPSFALVWELWCLCLARLDCWELNEFENAAAITQKLTQATSDSETVLRSMAALTVNKFVHAVVVPKFKSVLSRIDAAEDTGREYGAELQGHLEEMVRFGAQV